MDNFDLEPYEDCFRVGLWIPPKDRPLEIAVNDAIRSINGVNQLIDRFVSGELSENDFIEGVESYGVNIDDYIETVNDNLVGLFGEP